MSKLVFAQSVGLLTATFVASLAILVGLYSTLPALPSQTQPLPDVLSLLTRPRVSDISQIRNILVSHVDQQPATSLALFAGAYLLLQAFAIPGPVLLSILAGAIFGRAKALAVVTACTVFGSALCRVNFQGIGKPVFDRVKGVDKFREQIRASRDNLFWLFLFLRITPLLPNWFINMSSGNLGIPWSVFLAGTGLGLLPNNFIMVGIGAEIASHGAAGGANDNLLSFSPDRFASLLGLGLVALLPVLGRRLLGRKISLPPNTE